MSSYNYYPEDDRENDSIEILPAEQIQAVINDNNELVIPEQLELDL